MNMADLRCYLLGHRYHPEGERHGYYDCMRCEVTGYEPQRTMGSTVRGWISWKKYRLGFWWNLTVPSWIRKVYCRDCHRWFGRHTYNCLPF